MTMNVNRPDEDLRTIEDYSNALAEMALRLPDAGPKFYARLAVWHAQMADLFEARAAAWQIKQQGPTTHPFAAWLIDFDLGLAIELAAQHDKDKARHHRGEAARSASKR